MVSVNKQQNQIQNQNQSKKETNPNQPSTSSDTEDPIPNPNPNQMDSDTVLQRPIVIEGSEEDTILSKSEYLTREEVIRRRLRRVKQMERLYKDHYWSLMEELRVKYREYYWEFGISPFKENNANLSNNHLSNGGGAGGGLVNGGGVVEGSGDTHNVNGGRKLVVVNGAGEEKYKMCDFGGCKSKAMALATYCHQHIILDTRQTLYKTCSYITKSGGCTGTVCCGKTILSSNLPLLCSFHFQKAEKHVTRALRVAGLNNITSCSKLAPPKLHIIVAESVRQINAKRREKRAAMNNGAVEEGNNAQVS
ncbi:hypothetical protein MKW94_024726 [Papaver nudicaule]|uniref:KAT8 regulatory NSL complex subunit 2 n=1 Tax=Papaver nudicaule TaxID=74823 RepID=A0AA42B317_PAPNU|nr:hypothetical protein [Papaver nudicaule]